MLRNSFCCTDKEGRSLELEGLCRIGAGGLDGLEAYGQLGDEQGRGPRQQEDPDLDSDPEREVLQPAAPVPRG